MTDSFFFVLCFLPTVLLNHLFPSPLFGVKNVCGTIPVSVSDHFESERNESRKTNHVPVPTPHNKKKCVSRFALRLFFLATPAVIPRVSFLDKSVSC